MDQPSVGVARTAEPAPPLAHNGLVLATLILAAAVANLNLAVANVALPSIASAFDASQTALNLVAVGYSLGLASSVLYLGAVGDRYGRKLMLVLGTALAIPASLLAGFAPTIGVLFAARLFGGLAAGMAFPTTLALITALWSGPRAPRRSRCGRASAAAWRRWASCSQAYCWSIFRGARSSSSPCRSLLSPRSPHGSSFPATSTRPPSRWTTSAESSRCWPLSALVLSINFVSLPSARTAALGLMGVAFASGHRVRDPPAQRRLSALRPTRSQVAASSGLPPARASSCSGRSWPRSSSASSTCRRSSATTTLQAGLSILPAAVLPGGRGAHLGAARRVARVAVHAAWPAISSACSASS